MKFEIGDKVYTATRNTYTGKNIIKDEQGQYYFSFMLNELIFRKSQEQKQQVRKGDLRRLSRLMNNKKHFNTTSENTYTRTYEQGEKVIKTLKGQYAFHFMEQDTTRFTRGELIGYAATFGGIMFLGYVKSGGLSDLLQEVIDLFQ